MELSVAAAASLAGTTMQTIRNWCRTHHIGRKPKGRWVIDSDDLLDVLVTRDLANTRYWPSQYTPRIPMETDQ